MGLELGADCALDPNDKEIFEEIKNFTNSQVDVVIECVGSKETVENAVKIAGKGAKVVIFGLAPKDQNVTLNLQQLFHNELKIFNSFLNPFTFKPAIDLLINKKINVQKLVTKQVYLKNISNIFSDNNFSSAVKVQIINN